MTIRLNKYLAQCGLGSRRKVEELITAGRITINGAHVHALGTIIKPADSVQLDGKPLARQNRYYYLMLNKPRGYVTTMQDEKNRPTVMDLIPEKYKRLGLFPVGRLDKDTSGLLLLTNDGDLGYKLTKPSYNISKEYEVEIDRPLDAEDKERIARGIYIHQLKIKAKRARIDYLDDTRKKILLIIREGKNRQIRYTFMNLGYKVKRLERTAYGTISLKNIRTGYHRILSKQEIRLLKKLAAHEEKAE